MAAGSQSMVCHATRLSNRTRPLCKRSRLIGQAAAAALAAIGFAGFHASNARAADIAWTLADGTTISGDSDVSTTGAADRAYVFGGGSTTVNGVTFSSFGGTDSTTFGSNYGGYGGNGNAPFNTLSAGYQALLTNGYYADGSSQTITLNNLNTGLDYQVQVWVNDSRAGFGGRSETVTGGAGTVTLTSYNSTNNDGGVGQFATGTFTADNTNSEVLTFAGNQSSQVNGLQLRATGVSSGNTAVITSPVNWSALTVASNAILNYNISSNFSASTAISGNGAVTMTGSATLILSGSSNYSGGTTITSGVLQAASNSALGTSTVTLNGGTLQGGNNSALSNPIVINNVAGNTIDTPTGSNITLNGNITGSGAVTKTGAYSLFLGGDNSGFTGTFTNSASNTFFAAATAGSAGADWVVNSGQLLNTVTGTTTLQLGSLGGAGGTVGSDENVAATLTLAIGGDNNSTTFAGSIVDNLNGVGAGTTAITKVGTGTLVLSGSKTYSGGTTVNNGTLSIQNSGLPATSIVVNSPGVLQYDSTNGSFNQLRADISGNGTLNVTGGNTVSFGTGGGQTINWNLGAGAQINVLSGTMVGGTFANDNWTNDLASLYIAGGATFSGVEANVMVDALTGGGTFAGGYPGAGYANDTIGVNNGSGTFTGILADNVAPMNFVKAGTGTEILTGTSTYSGTTTVTGGTLQIAGAGSLGSGNYANSIAIGSGATLQYSSTAAQTFSGNISGAGGLVKDTSSSTLTLSGSTSYTGATTVNAGTLTFTNTPASSTSIFINSGAVLNYAGTASGQVQPGTTITGAGEWLISGGGNLTLGNNGTVNVSMSAGGLIDVTAGSVTSSSSYQGVWTNNQASLNVDALGIFIGKENPVYVDALTGSGLIYQGYPGPGLIIGVANGSGTFSGVMEDNGQTFSLTKTGTGTETLSGNSTYSGSTIVNGGTLDIATAGSLNGTSLVNAVSGGTLTIEGTVTVGNNGAFGVGTGTSGAGTVIVNSGGVLNIGNGDGSGHVGRTYIGGYLDAGGQPGSGTLTINTGGTVNIAVGGNATSGDGNRLWMGPWGGSTTNTLNIDGGTLSTARGIQDGGAGGSTLNFNGGLLQFTTDGLVLAPQFITFGSLGGTIDTQANTVTQGAGSGVNAGVMSGVGGFTKVGAGSLILTATNTFTGPVAINAGTLVLPGNTNNSFLTGNPNIAVNNGGTLAFSGYNTFGLDTTSMPAVTVNSGGTILSSNVVTCFSNLTLNNATISINGNDNYGSSWGSFGFGGTTTATGNSVINVLSGNGTISIGSGNTPVFTINTPAVADSLTISVVMQSSLAVIKEGNGTLTLAASNSYSGGTTVNGGTAVQGAANGLGSTNGSLTVNTGGTLDLGGFGTGVGNLTGTGGTITNNGSAATLTIGNGNNGGGNYAGVIQDGTGSLSLTKVGSGTITIGGTSPNTYSGLTTVSAGGLVLGSSAGVAAIPGNLLISGANNSGNVWTTANNQLGGANTVVSSDTAGVASLTLLGTTQTVAGLSSPTGGLMVANSTTNSGTSSPNNGGNSTLILTGSGNYTDGGWVWDNWGGSGTLALTVNLAPGGVQTLSGSINYSGPTTVNSGTLIFTSTPPVSSSISISSGAVLNYAGSASNAVQNGTTITGAGEWLISGGGNLTLGNNGVVNVSMSAGGLIDVTAGSVTSSSSYQGVWTNNQASLNVDVAGTFIGKENPVYVDALTGSGLIYQGYPGPGLIIGVANGSGTFSGTIEDNGNTFALTKNGTGTETLSGTNNTYSGGTSVNGGTVVQGAANAIGSTNGQLTVNTGGTLDLGGFGLGVGNLTGTGGAITNNGAAATLTIGNGNNGGGNYAGVIQDGTGSLSLTKVGTGVITIGGTAPNTYSGLTTVSAGGLVLGSSAGVATIPGNLMIDGGNNSGNVWATANNQLGGANTVVSSDAGGVASLTLLGTTQTVAGLNSPNVLGGGGGLMVANSTQASGTPSPNNGGTGTLILTGSGTYDDGGWVWNNWGGSGTLALTVNLAPGGVQTLSGSINYTGTTTVNSGTLIFTSSPALSSNIVINSGAVLNYAGTASGQVQPGTTITGAGEWLISGGGNLTLGNNGTVNVSMSAGGLIDVTAGSVTSSSSYQGVWTNNQASLNVDASGTFIGKENPVYVDALTGSGLIYQGYPGPGLIIGVANGGGTFSGVMEDNGQTFSLTKDGTGTEILTGSNTYSGSTTINGGILQIASAGFLGGGNYGGGIAIASGATFQYSSSATQTLAGSISGGGNLVKDTSASTLTLTGSNSYTGTTTVSAGTLVFTGSNYNYTGGNIYINGASTLRVNGSRYNFNGTSFIFDSTGGGTIDAVADGAGGFVFMGANTFVTNGGAQDIISGNGGGNQGLNLNGQTAIFNVAPGIDPVADLNVTAAIWNAGNVQKNGAGTLLFSGPATYSGNTTINAGTLVFQNQSVPSGNIVINSPGTLVYNLTSTSVTQPSATISGNGTLQKLGSNTLTFGGGGNVTWSLGSGALIDVEAGTLVGGSSIQDFWTGDLASLHVAGGATFIGVEANVMVDALTGSGTFSGGWPGAGYANDTIGVNNDIGGTATFTGNVQDAYAPMNLVKAGSGTQILSGSGVTYTGSTTVNGGTLGLTDTTSFNSNGVTLNNGANLALTASTEGWSNFTQPITGNGNVIINNPGHTSDSGDGDGYNFTLSNGGNSFSGNILITGGLLTSNSNLGNPNNTIQLAGGGLVDTSSVDLPATHGIQLTTANVNGYVRVYSGQTFTIEGQISGPGNLRKTDGGTLILNNSNTFTGSTTIGVGILQLGNNLAIQDSIFDPSGGGTLAFSSDINTPTFGGLTSSTNLALPSNVTALTLNPGVGVSTTYSGVLASATPGMTLTITGSGTQTLAASNTYTGGTTVSGGTLIGTSPYAFGGTNAGGGDVTVNPSGTVTSAVPGGTAFAPHANLTDNGTVYLTGQNEAVGQLNGGGNVYMTNAAGVLLTINNGGNFSGAITELTGKGSVTLTGGVLTLSGSNSNYSGGTTITGGTLLANGFAVAFGQPQSSPTGIGAVTVNGGRLGGIGTVGNGTNTGNMVSINTGGTISPGADPANATVGTLTTGDQTWNGGTYVFKTNNISTGQFSDAADLTSGSTQDFLLIGGNLDIVTGTPFNVVIDSLGVAPSGTASFTIANAVNIYTESDSNGDNLTQVTSGNFPSGDFIVSDNASGNAYDVSVFPDANDSSYDVVVTVAPEPSSLGLLGLASLGLLRRRRASRVAKYTIL